MADQSVGSVFDEPVFFLYQQSGRKLVSQRPVYMAEKKQCAETAHGPETPESGRKLHVRPFVAGRKKDVAYYEI